MAVVDKSSVSVFERPRVHTLHRYKIGIVLNIVGLLILALIVAAIFVLINSAKQHDTQPNYDSTLEQQSAIRYVTRSEWVAQPPDNPLNNLSLPVNRVIIGETQTESCSNQGECIFRVRMIQMYHIESRHFDDIAYNFLVGGDGQIYEGRGWNKVGAHTKGFNSGSIGIALIGEFKWHTPPEWQFNELKLLILDGIRLGKISQNYQLYAQHAFASTTSPGEKVVNEIKNWPHFVNKHFRDT